MSYGTTVHIDGLSEWEDKHIVDLAFAAHVKYEDQFFKDTQPKSPNRIPGLSRSKTKPTVTTTMVIDNTAYIATSLEAGGASYLFGSVGNDWKNHMAGMHIPETHPCNGNTVIDGLRRCQAMAVETDRGHKFQANCGTHCRILCLVG